MGCMRKFACKTNGFDVFRDGVCLQFIFQVRQVHPMERTQFFSTKKAFLKKICG
jgi:hypothetical protein